MKMKITIATFLGAALVHAAALQAQQEYVPDAPAASLPGHAPQHEAVKYTLLKPNDKTSEQVREEDRNPFGRSDAEVKAQTQKGTNEENEIRDLLAKLRVVGVSPGANGLRVMLGDMILEAGQMVPQVLPEQTIGLRVASITPEAINLLWIEAKPSGLPPRTVTIPVDLRPSVRVRLMGQSNEKNQWERQTTTAGDKPVTRQFPGTAQTPAMNPNYMADYSSPVPKAQLVEDKPGISPATIPAAVTPTEARPAPEWDQAMKLLQKLMPASAPQP